MDMNKPIKFIKQLIHVQLKRLGKLEWLVGQRRTMDGPGGDLEVYYKLIKYLIKNYNILVLKSSL